MGKFELANQYFVKTNQQLYKAEKWARYLTNSKQIIINLLKLQKFDLCYETTLLLLQKVKPISYSTHHFRAFTYSILSFLSLSRNHIKKAIFYDKKALQLSLKHNNLKTLPSVYINLASSYRSIGAFELAESYLKKAMSLLKNSESRALYANAFNNLAIVYKDKKEYGKALYHAKQALNIRKSIYSNGHASIDNSFQLLGLIYRSSKNYEKALVYFHESLIYRKKKYNATHHLIASALFNKGKTYYHQKIYDQALKHYHKSLYIWQKYKQNTPVTNTYNAIASVYQNQLKTQEALKAYQKALCYNSKTFKDSNNVAATPGSSEYNNGRLFMESLRGKAAVLMAKGDAGSLEIALKTYQLCDELIQKFRQQYVRHQDKLMLAKISAEVYENALVTCYRLMRQQKNKEALYTQLAFHFSERNKASILREALQEANARFGLPQKLVDQEQDLKVNLAYYTKQLANAQARKDSVKVNRYQNKLFDLNQQHEQLTQTLEKNYPSYYQLKYKTALVNLKRIQQSLPAQALLVEYFTTPSQLYAFAVSKTQAKMLALPGGKSFHGIIKKYGRSIKTRKRAGDFAKASYKAYQTLMAPLEPYMANKTQIIVISDGKLLGVPFEPLISKKAPEMIAQFDGLDFMIKQYQFLYHYSANLMVQPMLRKQPAQRNDFLGMAPVFTKNSQGNTRDESANQPPQALPYTEKEIDKISDVFKQNGRHQIKSVLHTNATEQSFKTIGQQYKYIHLATHSVTNAQQPELAYIQFEPTPANKDSYNEGKLYANEIYALSLNADLVVLSSCESGSGKIERGEGMMGLNRSFLYAGARHVMYSLWKVKDRPTSEFMINFYKKLVVGKHSFSKALQLAKQEYIKTHPLKRPHDWAGFLIIGQL
ncbi:CHAT domain-containing protein [Microscilla marina]